MTSPWKKSAASRINGRKSCGPRTKAGKARASRNARRHGLAAFHTTREPKMLAQIAQMVDAICQGDDDPQLREQARLIAENQFWLSAVRAQELALLERLRQPTAYALDPTCKLARVKARLRLFDAAAHQLMVIDDVIAETKAAGRDPYDEPLPPALKDAWPPPWAPVASRVERDDYELLREGLRDLERLVRYKQRACAGRKRAVRGYLAVKVTNHYQAKHSDGEQGARGAHPRALLAAPGAKPRS